MTSADSWSISPLKRTGFTIQVLWRYFINLYHHSVKSNTLIACSRCPFGSFGACLRPSSPEENSGNSMSTGLMTTGLDALSLSPQNLCTSSAAPTNSSLLQGFHRLGIWSRAAVLLDHSRNKRCQQKGSLSLMLTSQKKIPAKTYYYAPQRDPSLHITPKCKKQTYSPV